MAAASRINTGAAPGQLRQPAPPGIGVGAAALFATAAAVRFAAVRGTAAGYPRGSASAGRALTTARDPWRARLATRLRHDAEPRITLAGGPDEGASDGFEA